MTVLLEGTRPRDTVVADGPAVCVGPAAVEDRVPEMQRHLVEVARGGAHGWLTWDRPAPSAAFSRRDVTAPGFDAAVAAMRARGFMPFVRPVGGRLATYDAGSLVLNLLVRDAEPREGTTMRFRTVAGALAVGLRRLGVDARVGGVPGEYCPGTWSVNAGGLRKLAGSGQRLAHGAVLVTAVIVVSGAAPLREAMTEAYGLLGLELDPSTVGAVSDDVPGVTLDDVEGSVGQALAEVLGLEAPDPAGARGFRTAWPAR